MLTFSHVCIIQKKKKCSDFKRNLDMANTELLYSFVTLYPQKSEV